MSSNNEVIDERNACNAETPCEKGANSNTSLCEVTAADIMHSNVQVVHGTWSISMLAKFFIANRITGAPVVDEDEQLVGVVSSTDIMEFENISYKEKLDITRTSFYQESIGQQVSEKDLEQLSLHAEDSCTADSIMTPDIISVKSDASLPSIAQLMSRRHIHRVFVTENGDRIVGVISTSDILSRVAELCE